LLRQHTWFIDATASTALMQAVDATELPSDLHYCRCELAYEGKLGLFSIEGDDRNPRLDDIRAILFDMACDEALISQWLRANQTRQDEELGFDWEELRVGIGCSSETMRLSDDVVSFHASSFAIGFRHYAELQDRHCGYLQISQNDGGAELLAAVRQFALQPMTIIPACNDPAWQVRLNSGLEAQLLEQLKAASPNETGGILIGSINSRKKSIFVTRILPAPPDSKSSPYAFVRGVKDVPESVRQIERLTGGMLGYVGEWHTHPMGGARLSSTDMKAVSDLRRILDAIPLPTHVMIVTPQGLHPHVYAP
jgi:proteasome lid subunit RPN8/RPN11